MLAASTVLSPSCVRLSLRQIMAMLGVRGTPPLQGASEPAESTPLLHETVGPPQQSEHTAAVQPPRLLAPPEPPGQTRAASAGVLTTPTPAPPLSVAAARSGGGKGADVSPRPRLQRRRRISPRKARSFAFNPTSTDASYLAKIWPTVFILGVQKGGTTTLAHFMLAQPEFCINAGPWGGKESQFLVPKALQENDPDDYYTITGVDKTCSRKATSDDWEKAKTGAGPPVLNGNVYTGGRHLDATPILPYGVSTKALYESIPEELHSRLKFIVLLREPLSRDLSMYNHVRGMKADWGFCPETESTRHGSNGYRRFLEEGLKCSRPGAKCSDCMAENLAIGYYARSLKTWFSYFERQQFFILQSDVLDVTERGSQSVAAVLQALGKFLEVKTGPGSHWERSVQKGYKREHTARQYRGPHQSRLENLTPEQCNAAGQIYESWNKELYALLAETRHAAPAGEPPFGEFKNPCAKAAGLPEDGR